MSAGVASFEVLRVPFRFDDRPGRIKYRPAVVWTVAPDGATAILLKVTSCPPRDGFPGEVPLRDWTSAGLPHACTVRCSKPQAFAVDGLAEADVYGVLTAEGAQAVYDGVLAALEAAGTEAQREADAQKEDLD